MAAKSHVKERAQGTERPPQAGGPGRCPGRADSGAEPRGGPSGGLTARGGDSLKIAFFVDKQKNKFKT